MTGRSKKDLFGIINVLLFLKTTVIRASPILLPLLADWFASWQGWVWVVYPDDS